LTLGDTSDTIGLQKLFISWTESALKSILVPVGFISWAIASACLVTLSVTNFTIVSLVASWDDTVTIGDKQLTWTSRAFTIVITLFLTDISGTAKASGWAAWKRSWAVGDNAHVSTCVSTTLVVHRCVVHPIVEHTFSLILTGEVTGLAGLVELPSEGAFAELDIVFQNNTLVFGLSTS
jgi:hypothetical protein